MYDNNNKFTEKYVASGLYWNYFYHTWKTVSYSPFANAVTFVTSGTTVTPPTSYTLKIDSKDVSKTATVLTFSLTDAVGVAPQGVNFRQSVDLTDAGIAVQKYGAVIIPATQLGTQITLGCDIDGLTYVAETPITGSSSVGDVVTMTYEAD